LAAETARLEAEATRKEALAFQQMQAQLQSQLKELAAADAAAAQEFALWREKLARESMVVAGKLQNLQSSGPHQLMGQPIGGTNTVQAPLPPHLTPNIASTGLTPASGQHSFGLAEPVIPATRSAEPSNPASGLTATQTAASNSGPPRPEEALAE
jgi:hypothetical protein